MIGCCLVLSKSDYGIDYVSLEVVAKPRVGSGSVSDVRFQETRIMSGDSDPTLGTNPRSSTDESTWSGNFKAAFSNWRTWFAWLRFFRFGIKTIFVLMIVCSVLLMRETTRCENQAVLGKLLREKDRVYEPRKVYWFAPDGWLARSLALSYGVEWERDITSIVIYPQHSRGDAPIDKRVMSRMLRLHRLKKLEISNVLLTDKDFENLKRLTSLEQLILINLEIEASKLADLRRALPTTAIVTKEDR